MTTRAAAPADLLRVTRIIALALGAGVTLFALVAWYLHHAAGDPVAPRHPALFVIWLGSAVTLSAVSIMLWRNNVDPLINPAPGHPPGDAAAIQSGAIISWALVETAALFGVVVYFIEGIRIAGIAGVGLMWAALLLSWPRKEWFQETKP